MKKVLNKIDKPLFFLTIIYTILGLVMIFSSSSIAAVLRYQVNPYHFFVRQLIFLVFSYFIGFIFVLRFPIRNYKKLLPLIVGGVLLALIFLFPYGSIINSAQSWYDLGFVNVQPSEFAKTAIILYFAIYFSEKKNDPSPYVFVRPLAIGLAMAVLIAMQPDLGGAFILGGIVFFLFISIPLSKNSKGRTLKIIGVAGIIFMGIFLYFGSNLLNEAQRSRLTFKEPCTRYTENTGYQVCNSLIAVSNGGLLGKGLGDSTQKYLYLPESHTDFIFPIISEELGAVIAILIIIGYTIILWRILRIAKRSETLRGSIIAYGTFLFMTFHILVNLLGILSLIPLTGVPLPFLSYGGSFNLNLVILIFLVQRVNVENVNLKMKKEINNL